MLALNNKISEALNYLKNNDTVIAALIDKHPVFNLKPETDHFSGLVSIVISQQLSYKAFKTIETRLFRLMDYKVKPDKILALSNSLIRQCGISDSKCSYIKNIALYYKDNKHFFKALPELSDKQIIDNLIKIKGIGMWSIQMFLIFHLVRLDIFPVNDNGIRSAMKKLYHFKNPPSDEQLFKIAEKWGDFKTIATWYLWRSLDNQK